MKMRVLVISDTHGAVQSAFVAYSQAEPVDAIIHLGDGSSDADQLRDELDIQVISLAGNCDAGSHAPREILWECEGKRLLLTHGDAYMVKNGLDRLRQRALEAGVDAVLFGHTHLGVAENQSGVLMINPGSLSNYSHHRSYAILTITPEGITSRHFTID